MQMYKQNQQKHSFLQKRLYRIKKLMCSRLKFLLIIRMKFYYSYLLKKIFKNKIKYSFFIKKICLKAVYLTN